MLISKNKKLSALYAIFIVVYVLQTLLPTIDAKTLTKYHVSSAQIKLLLLTIAIPYIAIWLISLVGYLRLATYVELIEKDKDGAAFKMISRGILGLSLWLPLSSIIDNFFSQSYRYHESATANLVRLDNYLNLLILFIAFWLLKKGTTKLLPIVKRPTSVISQSVILSYIAFVALYVLLVINDPSRLHPSGSVTVASYYEVDWLIVLTLLIPRLISWFFGVQAVQDILVYRNKVKGKLYKEALNKLALGLAVVVALTVLLRCLQSLAAPFQHLNLTFILLIIYGLLIFMSVGYVLIAKGAKNLQKLEEL